MAELQRASVAGGGLYERLLQRLVLALDRADTAERPRDEHPTELKLRGLGETEMGLIRAYLDQDLHWLRDWHVAAEELALLEHQPGRAPRPPRPQPSAPCRHASLKQRQLLCTLCGAPVQWSRGRDVLPCGHCGSQLFRSDDDRQGLLPGSFARRRTIFQVASSDREGAMPVRYFFKQLLLPPGGLSLLLLFTFWWRISRPRLAQLCGVCGFFDLWLMNMPLSVEWTGRWLENEPALLAEDLPGLAQRADATVILSAGRQTNDSAQNDGAPNLLAVERLCYAVQLAKASALPVLVSGGLRYGRPPSEAALMANALLRDFGMPAH